MLDFMAGWRFAAACRGEDSAYFFPPSHLEERDERRAREGYAKGLCARCPVRAECLDYARSTRESHGIWGGMNELERKILLRKMERAAAAS